MDIESFKESRGRAKAVWWLSPSLLEPIDGPWGRVGEDFGGDPVATWAAILDWGVSLRVSHIITGIDPYMSDRVVGQWPFHYVCHFPHDPLARCFDDAAVERNIATVRAICSEARKRGVKILIHHYNFMAPERWVDARAGLARKLDAVEDPMWGRRFHTDRLGFLTAHICANDPEYLQFMERCWRELFGNFPELSGMMLTAGEFSYCRCETCTGGVQSSIFEEDAEEGNRDPRLRTRLQFIAIARKVADEMNRELVVRGWGMEQWRDHLPMDLVYATKFSVFDACRGGPDPGALKWAGSGRCTLMMHAIESENSGPIIWHDEAWDKDVAEKLNAIDSPGTIVHINLHWGHSGHCSSFISSRNIERVLQHLEPSVSSGSSAREFDDFFGGSCGSRILEAARLVAAVPLEMNSILHLDREGFTFHMPPWFDGDWRWPGVLGDPRFDPPPWANPSGHRTLTRLMMEAGADPSRLDALLTEPGTVIHHCMELSVMAEKAIVILRDCDPGNPAARTEMRMLVASAHIAHLLCLENVSILRARLAWHLVRTLPPEHPSHRQGRQTAALQYSKGIAHLRGQLDWARQVSAVYPDYTVHVFAARETFFRLPLATRIKIRQAELALIESAPWPITDEHMTLSHWDF